MAVLGKDPGRGWGPPPLRGYNRPRYWSREQCEQWVLEARQQWGSTETGAARTGGAGSRSPAPSTGNRLAQQTAELLRSKSADYAPTTRAAHLLVVPTDSEG
jgi:hypothetical protein